MSVQCTTFPNLWSMILCISCLLLSSHISPSKGWAEIDRNAAEDVVEQILQGKVGDGSDREPEPLEISADPRLSESQVSWELKLPSRSVGSVGDHNALQLGQRHREKRRGVTRTNCRIHNHPPESARNLIGPTLKRSDVATSLEEVRQKMRREASEAMKVKRTHSIPSTPDYWACTTSYHWRDLGPLTYPRHIKHATCDTASCANGLFQCLPKTYKFKVLRRFNPSDSTSFEEPNSNLPVDLRDQWRLISIEAIVCCECSNRPIPFVRRN